MQVREIEICRLDLDKWDGTKAFDLFMRIYDVCIARQNLCAILARLALRPGAMCMSGGINSKVLRLCHRCVLSAADKVALHPFLVHVSINACVAR